MKAWIACACVAATVSLGAQAASMAAGQMADKTTITSEEDYSKVMKDVGTQNNALRKAISTPAEADAVMAASKLEADFRNVHAYWVDKKVDDATTASMTALTAVQTISKALAAHDMAA